MRKWHPVGQMEENSKNPPIPDDNKTEEATASGATRAKIAAQCSAITVYKAMIGSAPRNVTVVWNKTLINHSLSISVERAGISSEPPATCRVDLKPWPFWSKKGFKALDVGDHRIGIYWDLRSAKFSSAGCPEPFGSYYVALVSGEEVVLLLGDLKKEAYRRTKARPSLDDATMVSKRDNLFGKRSFSTRARFDGAKREHEIVVDNSISGGSTKDGEMWIRVDGVVVIHVSNLHWKFRGNQTVMVDSSPVQVFWDVHDWLFGSAGMGQALFIFKPGAAAAAVVMEKEVVEEEEERSESDASCPSENGDGGGEVIAGQCQCGSNAPDYCFLLYAWKVE